MRGASRLVALAALATMGLGLPAMPMGQQPPTPVPLRRALVSGSGDSTSTRNGTGRRTGIAAARRAAQKRRNQLRHRKACR